MDIKLMSDFELVGYRGASPALKTAIAAELMTAWAKFPEARFGQLLISILGSYLTEAKFWNLTDERWLQILEMYNEGHTR